jgi:hypothetical protein
MPASAEEEKSVNNAILAEYNADVRFWRLRRETGEAP